MKTDPQTYRNAVANLETAGRIIRCICGEFNITTEELEGPSRHERAVLARRFAMYLIQHLTTMSAPKIGFLFNRDHTTVLLATRSLEDRCSVDSKLAHRLRVLSAEVKISAMLQPVRGGGVL